VSYYLGYSAMQDFFPLMRLKPNTSCDDYHCRVMQNKMKDRPPTPTEDEAKGGEEEVVHEDNDWGKKVWWKISQNLTFGYYRDQSGG